MNKRCTSIFEAHPEDRSSMLSLLHAIQQQEGLISPGAIRRIAQHAGLTDNEVYSFASFFPWLRFGPEPNHDAQAVPSVAGPSLAQQGILATVQQTSTTGVEAFCLFPSDMRQARVASRNFGTVNPEEIEDYIKRRGYRGLDKALAWTPEEVAETVTRSGLSEEECFGLTCERQWRLCSQSPEKERYVIGYAAGADPVSLIGCALLENDPHGVLEGMIIAGYASGASRGILFVDGRRSLALSRLKRALDQMQASGYIGKGILSSAFSFHIKLIPAAGPLPCGESRRVIPALEGRRPDSCFGPGGFKRQVLQGRPTVIHSAETLAKLPAVLGKGADWYAGLGIGGHMGTKLVTLAGCIQRPGLVEVPMGLSLREIIDDIGGGVPEGKAFKAVQVGGPTGGWLVAEDLGIPLGRQTMAATGTCLGSGSLEIVDGDACAVDLARRALLFASMQSCGHCNFCREGTRQMSEILHDIIRGRSKQEDLQLLEELSEGLQLGASCSLGRAAPDAFLTTFRRFRDEYEAHIKENRCLSGFCRKPDRGAARPNTKRQDRK